MSFDTIKKHSVVRAGSDDALYSGTLEHCIVFIEGFDAGSADYQDLRVLNDTNEEVDYHNVVSSLIERAGNVDDLTGACWDGYEAIGLKNKNGKMVPNCVPKK